MAREHNAGHGWVPQQRDGLGKATCPSCGHEFERRRAWQRFCAGRCRVRAWEAAHPRVAGVPEGSAGAPRPAGAP